MSQLDAILKKRKKIQGQHEEPTETIKTEVEQKTIEISKRNDDFENNKKRIQAMFQQRQGIVSKDEQKNKIELKGDAQGFAQARKLLQVNYAKVVSGSSNLPPPPPPSKSVGSLLPKLNLPPPIPIPSLDLLGIPPPPPPLPPTLPQSLPQSIGSLCSEQFCGPFVASPPTYQVQNSKQNVEQNSKTSSNRQGLEKCSPDLSVFATIQLKSLPPTQLPQIQQKNFIPVHDKVQQFSQPSPVQYVSVLPTPPKLTHPIPLLLQPPQSLISSIPFLTPSKANVLQQIEISSNVLSDKSSLQAPLSKAPEHNPQVKIIKNNENLNKENTLRPPQPFIQSITPEQSQKFIPNPNDKIFDPVLPDKIPFKQITQSTFELTKTKGRKTKQNQNKKSVSALFFGSDLASYIKREFVRQTDVLGMIGCKVQKKIFNFNFPSIQTHIRDIQPTDIIYTDTSYVDVVSCYMRKNKQAGIKHANARDQFLGSLNTYNWGTDVERLKVIKDSATCVDKNFKYRQLNFVQIKNCQNRCQNLIKSFLKQQNYEGCGEIKKIREELDKMMIIYCKNPETNDHIYDQIENRIFKIRKTTI